MKTCFAIVIFLLIIPFQLFSQDNPEDKITPEMREKFKNFKGKISGIVIDNDNGAPLPSVTIQLLKQKDSSVAAGGETDASGKFILTDIKAGRYKLVATYAGYKKALMTGITLSPLTPDVALDTIKMTTGVITETIDVTAEKPFIEFQPDKKVFNVEKGMSTTGGSAIDVLKNIPGVTVDQDNNISLRGSGNVKIMIDGRPYGLTGANISAILEQMPAEKILNIELMTNPTAKFEAEGSSGIININLKKNDLTGTNGNVSTNVGNGDRYNTSISLNHKTDKFNLSGSYDWRLNNMNMDGFSNRQTFGNPYLTNINQINDNHMRMNGNLVRGGIDWYINPKQTLGFSLSYNDRKRNREGKSYTNVYNGSNLLEDYITNDYNQNDGKTYSVGANYLLKFEKPKQTLSSDFSYTRTEGNSTLNNFIDYIFPVNPQSKMNQFKNEIEDEINYQMDYVHPLNENRKFELGMKTIFGKINDDSRTEDFDYNTGTFVTDNSLSNTFNYQELVNALYVTYTDKIGNFSYQLGLRGEQTNSKGDQLTANSSFTKSYFSLFPNASISQKLGATEELQLSYSRRIKRPDLDDLNPFLNTSDPLNYSSGNPNLMPEYTNSLQFDFIKYFTSAIITPSIFFRQTNDKISRVRIPYDSVITLSTQQNFASSRSYGFELTMNANPFSWWMLNGTVSYARTENDATNLTGQTNSAYSWSGRAFTTFNLPADFGLQLTYFYSGKNLSAQGQIDPFSNAEISLRKDFLDKRLSFGVRVSDVFNTQRFHGTISDLTFYDEFERKRDSRTVFLTVSYKFGSDSQKDRRKKRENNTEPIEIPDDY